MIRCRLTGENAAGSYERRCCPVAAGPAEFAQKFFGALGPGVITGAADDDPSGIATYSIAGAQLGTSLL